MHKTKEKPQANRSTLMLDEITITGGGLAGEKMMVL